LIAVAARADDSGWREFHSRAAGFRVEVPAEPQLHYSEDLTVAGKVVHHHYVIEHPAARFDLERLDLPAVAVFFLSARRLLERAKNGYVEELDAIVDGAEEIEVQGHPGIRLLFRERAAGSVQEETWFILAGRHLYMVAAGPFLPEVRSEMVDRVFSSFRICLEEGSSCDPAAMADSD
jgi:hypothetical protein